MNNVNHVAVGLHRGNAETYRVKAAEADSRIAEWIEKRDRFLAYAAESEARAEELERGNDRVDD